MARQTGKGTRPLFEDVGPEAGIARSENRTGVIEAGSTGARSAVRIWLMILFLLVALIIAVGGMTRLTDSGLSITEWAPISGALPPLAEADWQAEFALYQQTPEYQLQNKGMSLAEFQYIYWWEWGHRQLGRTIGLVWALGLGWFLLRRQVPRGWTGRLVIVGALIGVQGAIGWWMVSSGLEGEMLDVASYRLATHLGMAFVILGVLAWYIFLLGRRETDLMQARRAGERRLAAAATGLMHLTFVQVLLGALVAGIDAGRAFPTWPLMGDGFLPPDPFGLTPLWRNFFEDPGLVQFIHRMVAYVLFAYGIYLWTRARRSPHATTRFAGNAVMGVLLVQVCLGILTALYSAPLPLAILHQVTAVLLWVLTLRLRFLSNYPQATSLRGGR